MSTNKYTTYYQYNATTGKLETAGGTRAGNATTGTASGAVQVVTTSTDPFLNTTKTTADRQAALCPRDPGWFGVQVGDVPEPITLTSTPWRRRAAAAAATIVLRHDALGASTANFTGCRGSVSPVARRGPGGQGVDRVSEPLATPNIVSDRGGVAKRQTAPRSPAGPADRSGAMRGVEHPVRSLSFRPGSARTHALVSPSLA